MNTREEQIREKVGKMNYDVFITYRRDDGLNYAQLLYQALDKRGYKCFLDVRDRQDDEYEERIMTALRHAPNYIFLMTDGSLQRLSKEGGNIYNEVHTALGLRKKIIPVAPNGVSRCLLGMQLLDEFNSLRALAVSRLETGEFLEASVDQIVQRFPVKLRRVRWSTALILFASVIVFNCIMISLWMKSHSSRGTRVSGIETNMVDATVEPIMKRMKEIRLPQISFKPPATMEDAVQFFRRASKDYDRPDIPYEERGLKFVLRHGDDVRSPFDNDDGWLSANDYNMSENGNDSFASQSEWLPVMPTLSASDITLYEALELVCGAIDYSFVVRNGEIIVKPKNLAVDPLETWIYEVDGEFKEILQSWIDNDMTTKDGDFVFGGSSEGSGMSGRAAMALSKHVGVTWWMGSRVDYISSIGRLKVTNTAEEHERLKWILSEIKVLKSVRKIGE